MRAAEVGCLAAVKVAVVRHGRRDERMRELQENRPAPAEEDDRLAVDLARDGRSVGMTGQGTSATTRTGPPEPPSILIGSAITVAPRGGSRSRFVRFSRPGTFFSAAILCTTKSFDFP